MAARTYQSMRIFIQRCRVCDRWPQFLHGMCRHCVQGLRHEDLTVLDKVLDFFYDDTETRKSTPPPGS